MEGAAPGMKVFDVARFFGASAEWVFDELGHCAIDLEAIAKIAQGNSRRRRPPKPPKSWQAKVDRLRWSKDTVMDWVRQAQQAQVVA